MLLLQCQIRRECSIIQVILILRLCSLLPEGENSVCSGWVESFMMLMGLPNQTGSVAATAKFLTEVYVQVPDARDHFHSRSTLMQRLFSIHKPSWCSTSSLYLDSLFLVMCPTTHLKTSLYDTTGVSLRVFIRAARS